MSGLLRTIFYKQHQALGAKLVEFGGWEMPIQYPDGILKEHIATRRHAGIFDVSHMGRLFLSGADSVAFLQHVLTNNCEALAVGESQYTLIQNATGGAIDDAYLYRFTAQEYLLVVNASNREKDLEHLRQQQLHFPDTVIVDRTDTTAMISVQGPMSKKILEGILSDGFLPQPARNHLSVVQIAGEEVLLARTGYTGEPIGFELFVENDSACALWDLLIERGAVPIGLGARDTLRLEAALPLYGHELGTDQGGDEIPLFASKLSKFAVSFSDRKGDFIGRKALLGQYSAFKDIVDHDFSNIDSLPQMVMSLAITGKGIARDGHKVFCGDKEVGFVTSGTSVPYRLALGPGLDSVFAEEVKRRSVALALIDSTCREGDLLEIEIRNKRCAAVVVAYHINSQAPPYVRAIIHGQQEGKQQAGGESDSKKKVGELLVRTIHNRRWRQEECINLIPSEMSQSLLARILSISDPVNRYAEHKEIKAFDSEEVFYYQGTDFIEEVELLLNAEFKKFFDCSCVESRVISGQMANAACFSGLVDFLNRADRKSEQRRIRKIINNHIIRGGHLSAQPMGALRDFVARDPVTEKAAVCNFPVLHHNPYMIDVEACVNLIKEQQPELIILGKSMVIHREPVREIRALVDEYAPDCLIMYDMAHVLGLYGDHFQAPLSEGADIITGSTHKTFFGTQRGVVAANFKEGDLDFELWQSIQRRTFPGSVSNHHLGTMLGLLLATYEMNQFKDSYQRAVIENAKAFASALRHEGLDVAGDPEIGFTETHQVIVEVGYGSGARVAKELEKNNIIVNFQATPAEEGFTASGALRLGVSEMTRFGMGPDDFQELAGLLAARITDGTDVKKEIMSLRGRFLEMDYCFQANEFRDITDDLLGSLL